MQYTSSELGKMARDRDATIEGVAALYVRMLIPLIDDGDTVVVATEEGAKVATVAKLDADWEFYATDSAGTPLTDMVRKQQLIQLLPALAQLGVPPEEIKSEIVRLYDLPESFLNSPAAAAPVGPSASQAATAPAAPTEASVSDVIGGA
jgi:hypothetical protein